MEADDPSQANGKKSNIKEIIKNDLFKSFVRYWAIDLGERYPDKRKVFYSLSIILTSLIFIFGFIGAIRVRSYALSYDAALEAKLKASSPAFVAPGFSLFGLGFIKDWRKRVAIGILSDFIFLFVFVFMAFQPAEFFRLVYL